MNRIDSYELSEWMAYYSIEPFGEVRADWRQAWTSMILANANRPTDKRGRAKGKTWKMKDFMLNLKEIRRQQSPEQMAKLLQTLC